VDIGVRASGCAIATPAPAERPAAADRQQPDGGGFTRRCEALQHVEYGATVDTRAGGGVDP
jgi:hypothetical protein